MYAKYPKLAKEFEAATPKGAELPEHVGEKKQEKKAKKKVIAIDAYLR